MFLIQHTHWPDAAAALMRALPAVLPDQLSVVRPENPHIDLRVLAAAAVLTLVTSFVFGVLPALQASRSDLVDSLKQGGRGAAVIASVGCSRTCQ